MSDEMQVKWHQQDSLEDVLSDVNAVVHQAFPVDSATALRNGASVVFI